MSEYIEPWGRFIDSFYLFFLMDQPVCASLMLRLVTALVKFLPLQDIYLFWDQLLAFICTISNSLAERNIEISVHSE